MSENKTFTYTKEQAINKIADGHAILKPEAARGICEAIGVEYEPKLEHPFFDEPGVYKGAEIPPENEGKLGVDCLRLGSYIVSKLGLQDKAGSFMGRGFQGREYSRVIRESILGKED